MQHIGFLVSTLSSPGGTGRVVANVANRMVEDYEVHVIGAYHSGDGEPAFAYDSRVHRLNILPKEPRIREANKELYRAKPYRGSFPDWQLSGRLYYVHYAHL